jgi:hypothetical protein
MNDISEDDYDSDEEPLSRNISVWRIKRGSTFDQVIHLLFTIIGPIYEERGDLFSEK